METIATLWWLWITLLLIFGGLAAWNQVSRMKRMFNSASKPLKRTLNNPLDSSMGSFADDFDNAGKSITQGLGTMIVLSLLAAGSGILLIISVIAMLMGGQ